MWRCGSALPQLVNGCAFVAVCLCLPGLRWTDGLWVKANGSFYWFIHAAIWEQCVCFVCQCGASRCFWKRLLAGRSKRLRVCVLVCVCVGGTWIDQQLSRCLPQRLKVNDEATLCQISCPVWKAGVMFYQTHRMFLLTCVRLWVVEGLW